MTRIALAFVTVFAFVLSTHAQTSTLEAYLVLHGAFVIEGKQPDGDSIRFRPNQPELLQKLKRANRIEPSKDGTVQLRLEGIDAPELHDENVAQPFSKEPRNALLSWFGFSSTRSARGSAGILANKMTSDRETNLSDFSQKHCPVRIHTSANASSHDFSLLE